MLDFAPATQTDEQHVRDAIRDARSVLLRLRDHVAHSADASTLKIADDLATLHWQCTDIMMQIHKKCGLEADLPYLNRDLRFLDGRSNYKYGRMASVANQQRAITEAFLSQI